MRHLRVEASDGFQVLAGTERSEAATMVLAPGKKTGGPDNTHDADQWLYVLSGSGKATVAGEEVAIQTGDLVLIEKGETHEVANASDETPLATLNFYAPPEY